MNDAKSKDGLSDKPAISPDRELLERHMEEASPFHHLGIEKKHYPKAKHRCDDHFEDVFQALYHDTENAKDAAITLWKCWRSEPGKEPSRIYDTEYKI
ncbi:hypothetical protein QOT17_012132 [Balamuthia mandrillaris]